jgi:hypothetical protein
MLIFRSYLKTSPVYNAAIHRLSRNWTNSLGPSLISFWITFISCVYELVIFGQSSFHCAIDYVYCIVGDIVRLVICITHKHVWYTIYFSTNLNPRILAFHLNSSSSCFGLVSWSHSPSFESIRISARVVRVISEHLLRYWVIKEWKCTLPLFIVFVSIPCYP